MHGLLSSLFLLSVLDIQRGILLWALFFFRVNFELLLLLVLLLSFLDYWLFLLNYYGLFLLLGGLLVNDLLLCNFDMTIIIAFIFFATGIAQMMFMVFLLMRLFWVARILLILSLLLLGLLSLGVTFKFLLLLECSSWISFEFQFNIIFFDLLGFGFFNLLFGIIAGELAFRVNTLFVFVAILSYYVII